MLLMGPDASRFYRPWAGHLTGGPEATAQETDHGAAHLKVFQPTSLQSPTWGHFLNIVPNCAFSSSKRKTLPEELHTENKL